MLTGHVRDLVHVLKNQYYEILVLGLTLEMVTQNKMFTPQCTIFQQFSTVELL